MRFVFNDDADANAEYIKNLNGYNRIDYYKLINAIY